MKSLEKRGIVAKINGNNCIVLTPEGTYDKIPLPSPDIKVGAEAFYRCPQFVSPIKPWLLAASFLFFFMGYFLWDRTMLPQAVAYVSLDINQGVELAVDKDMRVIGVTCLDDEAAELVKQLSLEGKGLNDAVTEVVKQAIEHNYIQPGQDNLMISTVSSSGTDPSPVDQLALSKVMEDTIAARGCRGQVKIYAASDEFRQAAQEEKMSAGKYLLYEQAVKTGNQVSAEEVNHKSVSQLADRYQLDLVPSYKKINIKAVSSQKDKQIIIEEDGQSVAIEDYVRKHSSQNRADDANNRPPDPPSRRFQR